MTRYISFYSFAQPLLLFYYNIQLTQIHRKNATRLQRGESIIHKAVPPVIPTASRINRLAPIDTLTKKIIIK